MGVIAGLYYKLDKKKKIDQRHNSLVLAETAQGACLTLSVTGYDVFTTVLNSGPAARLLCVHHVHGLKLAYGVFTHKFKCRQFEYHLAIQSLKHVI